MHRSPASGRTVTLRFWLRKRRASALILGDTLPLDFAAGLDISYGGKRALELWQEGG